MNKRFSLLLVMIFSCLNLYAQTEKSVASVKWERYKISEREVSLELPKMPVAVKSAGGCSKLVKESYAVYAEETAYQIIIASKSRQKIPSYCRDAERFNQKTFDGRLAELRRATENFEESKLAFAEREVTKFSGKINTYWIFDDMKNDKWVELLTTRRVSVATIEEGFVKSLSFGKNSAGIEIGNGALRTLGDEEKAEEIKIEEKTAQNADPEKTEPMIIAFKPRASYTEAARQTNVQGAVTVRVTFLANGGIGSISVVSGLPYGLTEEAVKAASRIVFIPQTAKGKPISITKQVQYSFSIY